MPSRGIPIPSADIRISKSEAIKDLHDRINPKKARYHKTHQFLTHLVYAGILELLYLFIVFPLGLFIFSWFIGFLYILILGTLGALVVGPGFFLLMRHRYYDSLKVKKESAPWYAAIPVIVFTASVGVSQHNRAKTMGAADYLTKPLSATALKNAVARALRR